MASIVAPPTTSHKLSFRIPPSKGFSNSPSFSRFADPSLCRCYSSAGRDTPSGWRWDAAMKSVAQNVKRSFDLLFNPRHKEKVSERSEIVQDEDDWNWDRWKRHFVEVDDRERFISLLKSRLGYAIIREEFDEADRLKEAISSASRNDTVGEVMQNLKVALEKERYKEAAFLCDNAGAGLVGWWSGVSHDVRNPYGVIVKITAEHGRFVARRFSPRHLSAASPGVPLFEIYITVNKNGEYKQQAVYLKRKPSQDPESDSKPPKKPSGRKPSTTDQFETDAVVESPKDSKESDELLPFQNMLQDVVPGFKIKVVKVTAPSKASKDFISKLIDDIIDEEDEKESNRENSDDDNDNNNKQTTDDNLSDAEISVDIVIGSAPDKPFSFPNELLKVAAKLQRRGRKHFTFTVDKPLNKNPSSRKSKLQTQRNVESIMADLSVVVGKDRIPSKVLRDVSEKIVRNLNLTQSAPSLFGTTDFKKIDTSHSHDPLSEVITLQKKIGQWNDDSSDLEFYEYVEAVKLTGDQYVPAGQVAFRAKVGKMYELPHKGIIPEEWGVVARYKGQGRICEPGFRNPKWVDGELVVLDGKFIKGGPAVGFVYWAPEYHFFLLFNRLRLH